MIGALIALLGGSIGAFLGRYFGFLSKLPIFNKIGSLFKSIESIPWLGKLLKAVKIGFKWIGWPLQLLLGIFDFIKAFKETEGTLWEKLKEGLWAAIEGFIEMPVRLLTWAVEKVLEWFGIKFDGAKAADKIMSIVRKMFDLVFEGWSLIFDWIGKGVSNIIIIMKGIWNDLITNLQSVLPKKWSDKLEGLKVSNPEGDAARKAAVELEAVKAKQRIEDTKAIEKMGEGANTSQGVLNDLGRSMKTWMFNNNQQNNNSGGGDVQQISDETDNNMIGFGNYAGGFQ